MHESEWLPKALTKQDLLQICMLFNLSIDGFRKESLSTRPVEQIRQLVADSLKRGIGAKKLERRKVPIHSFYNRIAEDILEEKTELRMNDFNQFALQLETEENIRPYQKLALIYELFNHVYMEYYHTITTNITRKQDIFQGILEFQEEAMLDLLINDDEYPSHAEYLTFINKLGLIEEYRKAEKELDKMANQKIKLSYVIKLNSMERLLHSLVLLPRYTELAPSVFRQYVKEKEKYNEGFINEIKKQTAAASDRLVKVTDELQDIKTQRNKYKEQMNDLIIEMDKFKEEIRAKHDEINDLKKEVAYAKERLAEAEVKKELFDELIPVNNHAIIITNHSEERIKTLFTKQLVTKAAFNKLKSSGEINTLKKKTMFIDRYSFTNTKEWNELRNYLTQNQFKFVEYADYIELLKQYILFIEEAYAEEYL
ncbi:hypothetical protein [Paenibacillus sp. UNC499MF]|uniref:hypothetical protein n=1 Tax=Paenibacillus sp. UNC499MF TaxID=1502751 RepID=UPI0008A01515|nr:hypothetical protein [Paenibacillus sp. UNC499MF]SEG75550.1 hypothetical protein SAMN02799616_04829 [Paenibacillus sp. UNC499MF]